MKNNKTFTFSFKDKSDQKLRYLAEYSHPENSLSIRVSEIRDLETKDPETEDSETIKGELLSGREAWAKFDDNATFNEILKSVRLEDKLSWEEQGEVVKDPYAVDEIEFLTLIRDMPVLLITESVCIRLIDILEKANAETPGERNEAKENLRHYLVPIHPGGKKNIPHIPPLYNLMKRLANHLSRKCKNTIWTDEKDIREHWEAYYEELIEWGLTNEKRIIPLDTEELKKLLFSPSKYALEKLISYLKVSEKSIIRKLKNNS